MEHDVYRSEAREQRRQVAVRTLGFKLIKIKGGAGEKGLFHWTKAWCLTPTYQLTTPCNSSPRASTAPYWPWWVPGRFLVHR